MWMWFWVRECVCVSKRVSSFILCALLMYSTIFFACWLLLVESIMYKRKNSLEKYIYFWITSSYSVNELNILFERQRCHAYSMYDIAPFVLIALGGSISLWLLVARNQLKWWYHKMHVKLWHTFCIAFCSLLSCCFLFFFFFIFIVS